MTDYTEGVCGDGVAILREGSPVPISVVLQRLNERENLKAEIAELRKSQAELRKLQNEWIDRAMDQQREVTRLLLDSLITAVNSRAGSGS